MQDLTKDLETIIESWLVSDNYDTAYCAKLITKYLQEKSEWVPILKEVPELSMNKQNAVLVDVAILNDEGNFEYVFLGKQPGQVLIGETYKNPELYKISSINYGEDGVGLSSDEISKLI